MGSTDAKREAPNRPRAKERRWETVTGEEGDEEMAPAHSADDAGDGDSEATDAIKRRKCTSNW